MQTENLEYYDHSLFFRSQDTSLFTEAFTSEDGVGGFGESVHSLIRGTARRHAQVPLRAPPPSVPLNTQSSNADWGRKGNKGKAERKNQKTPGWRNGSGFSRERPHTAADVSPEALHLDVYFAHSIHGS